MSSRRRHLPGVLVLALHLGLGLGVHQALRRPPPAPAAAAPVHVWITWRSSTPPPPRQDRPADAARSHRPAAQPVTAWAAPLPASPGPEVAPQAITQPTTAAAAPAPAEAAASAPVALNLSLPARPALAPPPSRWAGNDPRANTAPMNGEQRMARSLGTDTALRTVQRGDGMELRRGNGCLQVQPTRAGQILPADSSAPRPSLVGNC